MVPCSGLPLFFFFFRLSVFFFFNDTATTEIYTLSLHDALPIYNLLGFFFKISLVKLPVPGPTSRISLSLILVVSIIFFIIF